MKKNLLLTLVLVLLCTTAGWAQFAPEEGKRYALQETTSGLYLDIQTLGVNEPNQSGTNNLSFNAKPCIIYFAAGTTDNTKWTMKNVNGTYAMQAEGTRNWNATIGATAYEWTINEPEASIYTIARADGTYIQGDDKTNGAPIYCDKAEGMKLKLVDYDDFQQAAFTMKSPLTVAQGAIQSSAALNAITTATKILVRSFSDSNSAYLGGATNVTDINSAVLVWEPVTEGTPGTYYLRTTDAENGYIQASTAANAAITLGTKTNAQVFVTTAPTTSGSDATYFNGESLTDGADTGNLVRFVQNGQTKWLNVNNFELAPRLGNEGKGAWTVHNVYLVTDATYLNLTTVSTTAASCQATATEFYIIPSADKYYLQNVADENQYIGYVSGENTWDVNTNFGVWQILTDDNNDGFAQVARGDDVAKHLGSDEECVVGKGVFNNVDDDCNGWFFNGVYENYTTTATSNGGKYEFTSGKIYTAGPCNKIRFTLTESAAYYKNGANRLSFDSFVLYDINGEPVELYANNITGNNGKVFDAMLDGTSGTYTAGTWDNSSATNDWFEIVLGSDVDLKGGFSFYFQTENTTMNAKGFKIELSYETPADYTFAINNAPDGAVVTFDGNPIATDDKIPYAAFDEDLLVATDIQGYTWSVAVDKINLTITLTYTEAPVVENPTAVVALINRIGGDGTDSKFKFVHDPSMNSKKEVFVIGSEDGKILIKGTTISAITTGIGWYLQNIARINIAWNSLNEKTVSGDAYADLSNIPLNVPEETHTSDAMYRYYLNTCVFGYSMTTWTWKRWQQEIDWMALHGVNMPLQLVGLEEVWRKFLTMEDESGNRKYKYTDEQAKAFVPGPAFIAWWAMNNLQGWGGTGKANDINANNGNNGWDGSSGVQNDAWYARQKDLAQKILERQRDLGMQPVLPGWSGMVPANFASISGYATRANGGWNGGFVRPLLLNVSNANYGEIAADYYKCLHEVMGESQYYSMDPFHEGGGTASAEDYAAMYEAMEAATPGSQWVIQQWQWQSSSTNQKVSLTSIPAGRLIVLDLFADGNPAFDAYNGFAPQDAVFSIIPNFGGRSGLMGRLTNLTDNYFKYKAKYSNIKGIGAAPEAIEQTPVTYDLLFQLAWMDSKPDVAEWVDNYAIARYGQDNEEIKEAWSLLRKGPLNYGADAIQGPVEDVWAAIPNLTATPASTWGKTLNDAINTYTPARHQMLIDATYKLISQSSVIDPGTIYESNYNYDLVELGGGVLADYAYYLLKGINAAKTAAGDAYATDATFVARKNAFLALIEDVDAFKGTNLNFRLGKWTQEARAAAAEVEGATTATADWYEYNNARTIISTWSSPDATTCLSSFNARDLNDYSYRSWQGMMKDYYLPRWVHFFENGCTNVEYDYFEWNWAHGKEHYVGQTAVSNVALTAGQPGHTDTYTREPEGNTLEKAKEVLGKYIIPVVSNTGTYYAYRCLTNDLTSVCTVIANAGQTIDLSIYFGELTGVSITGDFIDGTATDITQVAIIADATDGSHTGTITLTDGTVLTFAVVINPAYNGVYKLALKTFNNGSVQTLETPAEMFVQYNTTVETGSKDGYKLIAEETFSASDEADKYFIITPLGAGYSLSAQGLYLKQPDVATWNHINFSDSKNDAGAYLFTETETGIFKISSTASGNNPMMNAYNDKVMGNDASTKYSTFTITEVTTYPVTIPTSGLAINLPFNVVLPEGVTAYDVVTVGDNENSEKVYETISLATAGGVVKAGTPVILKATAGDYTLGVTVDNTGAVGSKAGSVLRGNFIKQSLTVSNSVSRYTFADAAFTRITVETELAGNSVYMELAEAIDTPIAEGTLETPESPEHPELTALIGNFEELIGKIAAVNSDEDVVEGKITLQAETENTAGYIWTNAQEDSEGPIADLVDGDPGTHFHTEYTNTATEAGYHYIEIDLGESNESTAFYFKYVTRDDANGGYPQSITVLGSNDKQNYTPVYTVSGGLPQSAGASYTSSSFETGEAYKYLRFKVETPAVFWHMGEFELYNVKVALNDTDYTTFRGIANNEVATAYTALQEAIATNASGTADEKQAAYESLKALYDALVAKLQYMDEGVYTINFGGNPVFVAYSEVIGSKTGDAADYKLFDPDNNAGTDGADIAAEGADALFTITHNGAGYKLQAQGKYLESTKATGWSVVFFSDDEAEAGVYMFEETTTDDVYKLKSNRTDIQYINDWGEYFGNDKAGDVSTFTLTQVTEYSLTMPEGGITTLCLPFNVTLPAGVTAYDIVTVAQDAVADRYEYTLELLASEGETIAKNTPVVVKGTAGEVYALAITMSDENVKTALTGSVLRGTFVKTTIGTDVANYTLVVTDGEATFNIVSADDTPVPANSCWMELPENRGDVIYDSEAQDPVIEPIEIVDGGVYRLHGRLSNGTLRTLYTNGSNYRILWTSEEKSDASTLFIAQKNEETGKYRLVSALANGIWSQEATLSETGVELTILNGSVNGTAMILGDNKRRFCVDSDNLDYFSNLGDAPADAYVDETVTTDFVFELVEDATVSYTLKMGTGYAYATLYLPYAVAVPDGVTAYVAGTPEANRIPLTVVNTVIPANEPAVLKRESTTATETFVFEYTTQAPADVNDNILTGKLIETLVEGQDGYRYYMLMKYGGNEKFFWILKEYDETGKLYTDGVDHTHIKCSANKAFLEMSELQASSSYSFQLPGTTGIEEIETEGVESDAIYDLHGRKIIEPVKGSIYIKNGKVFIAK